MKADQNVLKSDYNKSLLYLSYSVIRSDGLVHIEESMALDELCQHEKISFEERDQFHNEIEDLEVNQILKIGLEFLKKCSEEDQGKVLGWIYRLVEADQSIDVREARLLLYAVNASSHEIEHVIEISKNLPDLT